MKTYKVRKHPEQWKEIEAVDGEQAAEIYADEGYAAHGDIVSVSGVGKFSIHSNIEYYAMKVK